MHVTVYYGPQTYSGGRDIWGLHDDDDEARRPEEIQKEFHKPIFDDGLIEVVGLKNGWNTCAVLAQINRRIHGKRCGQGHEVMIEFTTPSHGEDLLPVQSVRWYCSHSGCCAAMCSAAHAAGCTE